MPGPDVLPRADQPAPVCRPGDKSCHLAPEMSRPENRVPPLLKISPLIDGSSHLPNIDLYDTGKSTAQQKDPSTPTKMSAEHLSELKAARSLDSWLTSHDAPQKTDRQAPQPTDRHPEPKVDTPKKPDKPQEPQQKDPLVQPTDRHPEPRVDVPKKPDKSDVGQVEFSEGDYNKAVEKAKELGRPLVMKFSATWCGPCNAMKPEWQAKDVQDLMHDKAVFLHVDADRGQALLQKFGVSGIPTTMIARPDAAGDLKVQQRMTGGMSHDQLLNFLKKGTE